MNYLSQLEEYVGFKCSTVKSFTPHRVGFTEFINRMHACSVGNSTVETDEICSCDLGTGGWSHTEERYNSVTFLVPFIHDSMQTITHVKNTNRSEGGAFFLVAFSPGVWLTTLCLIIAFIYLKLIDEKFDPVLRQRKFKSWWDKLRHYPLRLRSNRWWNAFRSVGTLLSLTRNKRDFKLKLQLYSKILEIGETSVLATMKI